MGCNLILALLVVGCNLILALLVVGCNLILALLVEWHKLYWIVFRADERSGRTVTMTKCKIIIIINKIRKNVNI